MSTLSDDPLYQELLEKGYKPGFHPNTGKADVVFMLNVTKDTHNVELDKLAPLSVLEGGINNNPSETISRPPEANEVYSATLTPNAIPALTDRIAFDTLDLPLDQAFCYGLDLDFSTVSPSLRIAVLGFDPQYQYVSPNIYAMALAGLSANSFPSKVNGRDAEPTVIYNISDVAGQSLQLKGITDYKPDLISLQHVGPEVFDNQTFAAITDGYVFDLDPRTQPLSSFMITRTSLLQDFRWSSTDPDFDGFTFGFAFRIGDDPRVFAAVVDITYVDMFVSRTARVFDGIMTKIVADNPDVPALLDLFAYVGTNSFAFNVGEDAPQDTSSNMGPSFNFVGIPWGPTSTDDDFLKVVIDPTHDFGSAHPVVNIGRDYSLGSEIEVAGEIEHKPYPIFTQSRITYEVSLK